MKHTPIWMVIALAGLLAGPVRGALRGGPAGAAGPDEPEFETVEETGPQRKESGWWRQPAEASPEAQLARGDRLAGEGRAADAARAYDRLVRRWPEAAEAPVAQRRLADLRMEQGRYEKAFEEYQYLVEFYDGHFAFGEVLDRQYRAAEMVLGARHGGFWFFDGFAAPERALPLFETLARNAPSWERAPEVWLTIGDLQAGERHYEEAVRAYEGVQQRWPGTSWAEEASYARAAVLARMATSNPRDEGLLRRALSALAVYERDFPRGEHADEAEARRGELTERLVRMHYERAAFYDRLAHRPAAAVVAYEDFLREFPYAPQAPEVSRRLEELKQQLEADHPAAEGGV